MRGVGRKDVKGWYQPPGDLHLSRDHVDVWRTCLDLPEAAIADFAETLSSAEHERAARFRMTDKRNEYIIARGLLRRILARALGGDPQHFIFTYGAHGKPALAQTWKDEAIHFNVSHTQNVALVAVSLKRLVGVDVEHMRPNIECETLAQRFFSSNERASLMDLRQADRRQAFFTCWTRKEAFIKAVGKGLSLGLDQFDVSLQPGEPAALLVTRWDASEASRWSIVDLDVGYGYSAAIAIEGHGGTVRCWEDW